METTVELRAADPHCKLCGGKGLVYDGWEDLTICPCRKGRILHG